MIRRRARIIHFSLRNLRFLLLFVFTTFIILYLVTLEFQETIPLPITIDYNLTSSATQPIFGTENFTEYIPGHLPLIIAIPHGGHLFPSDIPDRRNSFPGVVKSNDINTQEIGRAVVELLGTKLNGRKPYVIINHLGRSKIDVNRPLNEGAEGNGTEPSLTQLAWNDYHTFMTIAIREVEEIFGYGLMIDLHGHGHPKNYIELGYVLSSEVLSYSADIINTDPAIPSGSSIRALHVRKSSLVSFDELLRGEKTSLGGKLQSLGYDTIPSHIHQYPLKDERYFHGGYCIQKYGSRHREQVVDAIQIEMPRNLRFGNKVKQKKFVEALVDSISSFLKEYYQ